LRRLTTGIAIVNTPSCVPSCQRRKSCCRCKHRSAKRIDDRIIAATEFDCAAAGEVDNTAITRGAGDAVVDIDRAQIVDGAEEFELRALVRSGRRCRPQSSPEQIAGGDQGRAVERTELPLPKSRSSGAGRCSVPPQMTVLSRLSVADATSTVPALVTPTPSSVSRRRSGLDFAADCERAAVDRCDALTSSIA